MESLAWTCVIAPGLLPKATELSLRTATIKSINVPRSNSKLAGDIDGCALALRDYQKLVALRTDRRKDRQVHPHGEVYGRLGLSPNLLR